MMEMQENVKFANQPVVILSGRYHPVADSAIPDCELVIVEGAGHFLHFERPEIMKLYHTFFEG